MHAQQTHPQHSNADPVASLIRDRATASDDYAGNPHRFEGVTAQDLDHDEAALNAVAAPIALLVRAQARIDGAR
jgi:hypothetical protein